MLMKGMFLNLGVTHIDKQRSLDQALKNLAERQGFEPWEGCPSTVFKTAAFDHSATSPATIL